MGDQPGHPFRGNQWSDGGASAGEGSSPEVSRGDWKGGGSSSRTWEVRGVKDERVAQKVNDRIGIAQRFYERHGQALADHFGLKFDSTVGEQVQFYNGDAYVWYEILKKRRQGMIAVTKPGSRAIFLSAGALAKLPPGQATALILHEMMHSQGLPESGGEEANQITREVAAFVNEQGE